MGRVKESKLILIGLLTTIVIIAVILVIAIPGISSIVEKNAKSSFEDNAKMLIEAINDKKLLDNSFDPTIINDDNIMSILNIPSKNYSTISVVAREDTSYISVVGAAEWSGLIACGTYDNLKIIESQTGECDEDLIPPTITILGDNLVNIFVGEKYIDEGATASDENNDDLTSKILVNNSVDYTTIGTYKVIYTVADNAGNITNSSRTVNVLDNIKPIIVFKNNGNVDYSKTGSTAVTVIDAHSGVDTSSLKYLWSMSTITPLESNFITTFTNGEIINTPAKVSGKYYLWILSSDNAGNKRIQRSNAFNLDNTSSNISFGTNGNNIYAKTESTTVVVNDDYSEINKDSIKYLWSMSTIAPNEAGFVTTFTNGDSINTPVGVTGKYYLWILSRDNADNTTITRSNVFKIDNNKPVITLIGNSSVTVNAGTPYIELGATATDNIDTNITVTPIGTVNVNIIGTYIIIYNAIDSSGNAAVTAIRIIDVVDKTIPTVTFGANGNNNYAKARSTTVLVSDTYSGVNPSSLKYLWTPSTSAPLEATFTTSFANGDLINTPANVSGSYYLWILAKDIAGNTTITRTNAFNLDNDKPVITLIGSNSVDLDRGSVYSDLGATVTDNVDSDLSVITTGTINPIVIGTYTVTYNVTDKCGNIAISVTRMVNVTDINYVLTEGVNKPKLATGMTPIKWDGSTWIDTTEADATWYNYTTADKQWANARTADGSMWVWIPRYIYKIPTLNWHTNSVGIIDIQFTKGVYDNWNNSVIGNVNTDTTANASNNTWTNHPSFTFGNTELTGIWISKFEASGTIDAVDSKPNVTSLRSKAIGILFTAARNMETNTRYGWGASGTSIDTHMMKNSEWGAATYLTQSIYGKNAEVWANNSGTYATGCAGVSASAASFIGCENAYNTTNGLQASTTGNIYGVYDMSGGAVEYVVAYINNDNLNLTTYGSTIINADNKYKDIYSKGATDVGGENYDLTLNKKGDAIYETSVISASILTWNGASANMPKVDQPWFIRGGLHNGGIDADIFRFYVAPGNADSSRGFRSVILVGEGL